MEIVEVIDPRIRKFVSNHLKNVKDHFLIWVEPKFTNHPLIFLVWMGGEIKVKRAFSNKRMSRIKTKSVELTDGVCRSVVGLFRYGSGDHYMILRLDDICSISYEPSVNVKVMNNIIKILERLKIEEA